MKYNKVINKKKQKICKNNRYNKLDQRQEIHME